MNNRDVTSALMVFIVVWNMYGYANNVFERAWRGAPLLVTQISYLLNAALVVFAPLTRSGKTWTVLASTMLGILMGRLVGDWGVLHVRGGGCKAVLVLDLLLLSEQNV